MPTVVIVHILMQSKRSLKKVAFSSILLLGLIMAAIFNFHYWCFLVESWKFKGAVELIKIASPQTQTRYSYKDGKLEADARGWVTATPGDQGKLVISFDRGGGHLGARGFVYCDPDCDIATLRALHGESIEFEKLNAHWWYYDSSEE